MALSRFRQDTHGIAITQRVEFQCPAGRSPDFSADAVRELFVHHAEYPVKRIEIDRTTVTVVVFVLEDTLDVDRYVDEARTFFGRIISRLKSVEHERLHPKG